MKMVNIHKAKTQLSKLVDEAANGLGFIIAKAGKPMVMVVSFQKAEPKKIQRLGFLKGKFHVPKDFDTMHQKEIEALFYKDEEEE